MNLIDLIPSSTRFDRLESCFFSFRRLFDFSCESEVGKEKVRERKKEERERGLRWSSLHQANGFKWTASSPVQSLELCTWSHVYTQRKTKIRRRRSKRGKGKDEHPWHHWNASQVQKERIKCTTRKEKERERECLHLRFARVILSMCSLFTFHSTLQEPSDQSSKATTWLNKLPSGITMNYILFSFIISSTSTYWHKLRKKLFFLFQFFFFSFFFLK